MTYSIIVLIYHRTPELVAMAQDAVASIKQCSAGENYELILVDNGSTEDAAWAREAADIYIRFNRNRGISAGWNAGLRAARGDFLVICGDDIIVCPEWLKKMKLAATQKNAGMGQLHIEHLPAGAGIVSTYKWLSGACFLLPRATIDQVGYFDERFFPANFEDLDMWIRIMGHGLKLYVNYSMTIQHREGATLHAPDISEHFESNRRRFIDKWGFNPHELFYGNGQFYDISNRVAEGLAKGY